MRRKLLIALGLCVAFIVGCIVVPDDEPLYFGDEPYPEGR